MFQSFFFFFTSYNLSLLKNAVFALADMLVLEKMLDLAVVERTLGQLLVRYVGAGGGGAIVFTVLLLLLLLLGLVGVA